MAVQDYERLLAQDPTALSVRTEYIQELYQTGRFADCLEQIQIAFSYDERVGDAPLLRQLQALEKHLLSKQLRSFVGSIAKLVHPQQAPVIEKGRVVEMVIKYDGASFDTLQRGLQSKFLEQLELLSVVCEAAPEHVMAALGDASLPSLIDLNVWVRAPLPSASLQAFAHSALATKLESFYLRADVLSDEHVMALMSGQARFFELRLRSTDRSRLTAQSAKLIVESQQARALQTLGIMGSSIGDEGTMLLSTSKTLCGIRRLELFDGVIRNQGARMLASNLLPRLEFLDLRFNEIDDAGLHELRHMDLEVHTDGQFQRPPH
ncbi:MAG: hypothetical protein RBU37_16360 [Myxococcota bacterium]|jgi:hypothetical protein|nr:hypothetical protein [Myxococcota bacterium]